MKKQNSVVNVIFKYLIFGEELVWGFFYIYFLDMLVISQWHINILFRKILHDTAYTRKISGLFCIALDY